MFGFKHRYALRVSMASCLVAALALGSVSVAPHAAAASAPAVTPTVSVSSSTIPLGSAVAVSGTGFLANEAVAVTINQQSGPLATVTAGPTGTVASTPITIPLTLSLGVHTLTLTGSTSNRTASTSITLIPGATVTPLTVPLGGQVTVAAAGFAPNEQITIAVSTSVTQPAVVVTTATANASGALPPAAVTIPATLPQGTGTVVLTGVTSRHVATAQLVLSAEVPATLKPLLPTIDHAGADVFSGSNWAPNEPVTITISGLTGPLAVLNADAGGNLPLISVRIPDTVVGGAHTLTATGALSQKTATATLTISAVPTPLLVAPTATNPGGLITVSGGNFTANEGVVVTIDGLATPLATLTADANGQLPATGVSMPYNLAAGTHTLRLTGSTSKTTATATIAVAALSPAITLSTTTVRPGNVVTVSGTGFGRQEQVTLALNGAPLTTTPPVITTNNSAFTATLTVPGSLLRGANTISAIGNESRAVASANVIGVIPIATTLYFAGASTLPGELAVLPILNTNAQTAHVYLTFYFRGGVPLHARIAVEPHSHATANLNVLAGANRIFGVKLTSDGVVAAQLHEFRSGKDGYGLLGVTAPNTTWYLAEGYTGLTFHETLALVNPGLAESQVQLHLLPFGGRAARTVTVSVAPRSTHIVDVNSLMPNQSLSVIAQASQPIVLARKLTFSSNSYGVTAKTGVNAPATTWIFAEGATTSRFQTFLTILNPNTTGTYATASFYGRTGGSLGTRTVYLPALSRANLKLNRFLSPTVVAAVVTSDIPVVVERPEYFGDPNRPNVAGSDVFGRNGTGLSWTFPDGNTLSHLEFLRIYNPSLNPVSIVATFYESSGKMVTKQIAVPPTVQYSIDVNALVPNLAKEHSITLRSVNGQGFVAEQTTFAPNFSTLSSTQGFAS